MISKNPLLHENKGEHWQKLSKSSLYELWKLKKKKSSQHREAIIQEKQLHLGKNNEAFGV